MSRAYRVSVRESLRRVLRGEDRVRTSIELLPVLPPEQLAELLAEELQGRGFREHEGKLVRNRHEPDGSVVRETIDPKTGDVTVAVELGSEVTLDSERSGWVDTDWGSQRREDVEKNLRDSAKEELEKAAAARQERLRRQATDRLEREFADVQQELDQVVSRVTAEALKRKAASLGRIKELSENEETGEMTIVVEV